METAQLEMQSEIGTLYLVASPKGLRGIFWTQQDVPFENGFGRSAEILRAAQKEIHEYLSGSRKQFTLELDAVGTEFQKKVWDRLSKIPYGETRSYKEIAVELNDANASRAVGTANGRNPLCIVVPCHRVIAADGTLGGYSGGLDIKTRLLGLERNGILQSN